MHPMHPMNPLDLASHGPVIPVIVIDRIADAVPLARALVAGGVKVLEVTLRTPAALDCIRAMAAEVPEAIVGAGTVRSVADAEAALAAGWRAAVSPRDPPAGGRAGARRRTTRRRGDGNPTRWPPSGPRRTRRTDGGCWPAS